MPLPEDLCNAVTLGMLRADEVPLPEDLCNAVILGMLRADEVCQTWTDDEARQNGWSVRGALRRMQSSIGVSDRLSYDPKWRTKKVVKTLYCHLRALMECQMVEDVRHRYYCLAIMRIAVLISYDHETGALCAMDGHAHGEKGAFIALSTKDRLREFCQHILEQFMPYVATLPANEENGHVLQFEFHRFVSQGGRQTCAFNTAAFGEYMINNGVKLPLWTRPEGGSGLSENVKF
uniref:Uncharacterized protein n=1 Tax=Panagrolaimus sp. ES5 TaxID=591445 RepID=A0AC34G367_9BILA